MTAALGSGSAPLPSLPQPWARALPLVLGSAASRLKPPISPPVALPRMRICALTRSQVRDALRRRQGQGGAAQAAVRRQHRARHLRARGPDQRKRPPRLRGALMGALTRARRAHPSAL